MTPSSHDLELDAIRITLTNVNWRLSCPCLVAYWRLFGFAWSLGPLEWSAACAFGTGALRRGGFGDLASTHAGPHVRLVRIWVYYGGMGVRGQGKSAAGGGVARRWSLGATWKRRSVDGFTGESPAASAMLGASTLQRIYAFTPPRFYPSAALFSGVYLRWRIVSSSITVRALEKSIWPLLNSSARYRPGSSGANCFQRRKTTPACGR